MIKHIRENDMTIRECYAMLGGNYDEILERLSSESMVDKFVGFFLSDESYDTLVKAMESRNKEDAFRAAHTLKGVCANLSFTDLFQASSNLTEELRKPADAISAVADELFVKVKEEYEKTVNAIHAYKG